jgi:hypothetical protein
MGVERQTVESDPNPPPANHQEDAMTFVYRMTTGTDDPTEASWTCI